MKILTIFLTVLFLSSCEAETSISKKEKANIHFNDVTYPCLVAHKTRSIKIDNKNNTPIYYTILYSAGNQTFDTLRLIVSEFDISKDLKVDSNVNYASEEDQKKLVKCLQTYNENSLVQDLWSDMKESLDEEDDTRWVTDKNGNNRTEDGFYPESILIESPSIRTFKVDNMGAEIRSQLTSNHADTQVTTIRWKFKDGKYVFDKYTTTTIDDYDPEVD